MFAEVAFLLQNDDIFRFKVVFERLGERLVGNQNVDILRSCKGVRLDFADFRAVQDHIGKLCFFANDFEQVCL